ncbi:hypothetical protein EGK_08034 [Macaca mulatta]|uniref:Uncharacterized protein n=1 Tax=Macaca mulatta TaxID=9544 RepID=G7NHW6_MACMU|nr:hypothetical protein EGK_08034 [Macaca mulatta]
MWVFTLKIRYPLIIFKVQRLTRAPHILLLSQNGQSRVMPLSPSRETVWFCSKNVRWKLKYVITTEKLRWCCLARERTYRGACRLSPRALVPLKEFSGRAWPCRELARCLVRYWTLGDRWWPGGALASFGLV